MRKPEQTTEPSIEEILASIRRIIADEGSSAAPAFDQGGPGTPQRSYPPHRDDYSEDDARLDESRARGPHFDDREPQYREAPRRDPRYDEPRQDERPRRGPQPHDFAPAPQEHNYRDPRGRDEYDDYHERQPANGHRSRGAGDYAPEREFQNGDHDDYQSREPVSADRLAAELSRSSHFNGTDFDRAHDRDDFERRGNARHDFGDESRAASSFDPYATQDDFDIKSARALNNADDEILELTEDFMVEEASNEEPAAGVVENYEKYDSYDAGEDAADDYVSPLNFADLQPSMAPISDFAAAPAVSASEEEFAAQDEAAPIVGTMSPLTDDSFEDGKLDSVLSNVVAEMQRLSEGKGLSALLDDGASQDETEGPSEAMMPAFAEEPQPQPRAWQPKARQASSAPAQRPVWSARRLDGDGTPTSPRTSTTSPLQTRERLSSASVSPLDDELGSPFGEAMAPKPSSPDTPTPQQPQGSAPTALARDANLKVEVDEIMPELPEGDFPPEQSGQASERSQTKAMIETLAAARASRKVESATSDETPELPSGADEEVVEQAQAVVPKAVTKPVAAAPVVPIAAPANSTSASVPVATAASSQPRVTTASAQVVPVSNAAVEKIAAAALPAGIEDSVREMLKPLIAEWLQENLPRLAEEVLREEILDSGALAKRGGRG